MNFLHRIFGIRGNWRETWRLWWELTWRSFGLSFVFGFMVGFLSGSKDLAGLVVFPASLFALRWAIRDGVVKVNQ